MRKSLLFFISLYFNLGISSCFSNASKVQLKSNVDNSVDASNIIDLYSNENNQSQYTNKPKYTVSFYSIVGTSEFCTSTRTVIEGEKVSPPEDFERPGYVFKGWYLEREYINLFDFNDGIYDDISIYARWEGDFVFSENDDNQTYTLVGYTTSPDKTEISIPSTYSGKAVVSISDDAFNSNLNITRVIIPESITSIGDRAFYNCQNLKSIRFPSRLERIGSDAFAFCNSLEDIYYSNTITNWAKIKFGASKQFGNSKTGYIFANPNIRSFNTFTYDPSTLDEDSSIYYSYITPTVINISSDTFLTSLSDYCYYGLKQIESVYFSYNSFTTVGKYSFAYCSNLSEIVFSGSTANKELSEGSFFCDTNLETMTGTTLITSLGDYCFYGCKNLSSFVFNINILKIDSYAFYDTGLTEVVFNNAYNLDIICTYAFASCKNLTVVSLKKLSFIEACAFNQCTAITTFEFGGTQADFQDLRNRGYYGGGNDNLYSKIYYPS